MRAFFAVELSSEEKAGRAGIARNASEAGLLVVTRSRFRAGEKVKLTVYAGSQNENVSGRVMRVEENPIDSAEIWRWRLAIALEDATLPEACLLSA
ncbi:hypothetical protein AKJ09_03712 [Labilithrix luteola]|uniref:PilZ domain-containing protein n=1 Tax=Labilithrix luteola TaxID=1391654 RepID=A0A0K1PU30_9BACT|nr:hypothetical protein AKJ09_03712 [Labilithrix luteola]